MLMNFRLEFLFHCKKSGLWWDVPCRKAMLVQKLYFTILVGSHMCNPAESFKTPHRTANTLLFDLFCRGSIMYGEDF